MSMMRHLHKLRKYKWEGRVCPYIHLYIDTISETTERISIKFGSEESALNAK
jgi:hypothetical protein